MFRIISLSSLMGFGGVSSSVSELIVSISGRYFPLHLSIKSPSYSCANMLTSSKNFFFLKKNLSIYFKVESPDDQVYFRQTRASNKAKTRRKTKVNLLSLEQELDINECFFPKNFKKPTRIPPCSILDRFVQWSHHLEKNHTKLTNASSKNFKGLKFLLLSS
jgi:hypothetical protein